MPFNYCVSIAVRRRSICQSKRVSLSLSPTLGPIRTREQMQRNSAGPSQPIPNYSVFCFSISLSSLVLWTGTFAAGVQRPEQLRDDDDNRMTPSLCLTTTT